MKKITETPKTIGEIGNYYGCLGVVEEAGKCYWCIENYDGHYWQEIPKHLYDTLVAYENDRKGVPSETTQDKP